MASPGDSRSRPVEAEGDVSVLDHALWSRFSDDRPPEEFAKVWIALLTRQMSEVESAAVVLQLPKGLVPVAVWPTGEPPNHLLTDVMEAALEREAGVVREGRAFGLPLSIDGSVVGLVGLVRAGRSSDPSSDLRTLRWGSGWLVSALRSDLRRGDLLEKAKLTGVLDLLGGVLEAPSAGSAAVTAANHLKRSLGCDEVAIGFLEGRTRSVRVRGVSDMAEVRMNTTRTLGMAEVMTEATDQEGTVLFPPRKGAAYAVSTRHAQFARASSAGELLTVPLFGRIAVTGAIHFRKPPGATFETADLLLAEAAAAALGPLFEEKRKADRSALRVSWDSGIRFLGRLLGPGYLGRKLVLLALVAMTAFFATATGQYRVSAESSVEGQVVRSVSAPFDGHIQEQFARAGDVLTAGAPLARLDDRDLQLELVRWATDLSRYQGEYDRALSEREASAALIAAAEIEQSRARMALIERQIGRALLVAPFDAVVIEGDLSQSVGAAVTRGQELFRIAPLDEYRVRLEVDETELDEIEIGQSGKLVLTALPDRSFPFRVTQITPRLEAAEGRNYSIIEAELRSSSQEIRPGMRGVAKVEIEERLLIGIWVKPMADWLRLAIWRWVP